MWWLQDTNSNMGVFEKVMKTIAITLILCITGGAIRNRNSQPNLAKFQREIQVVETFDLLIFSALKNTPRLRYGDWPVSKLEESLSRNEYAMTLICS